MPAGVIGVTHFPEASQVMPLPHDVPAPSPLDVHPVNSKQVSAVHTFPSSHPTSSHPEPSALQVAAFPCAEHCFAPGEHTTHLPSQQT
jgi:hypothetical protein